MSLCANAAVLVDAASVVAVMLLLSVIVLSVETVLVAVKERVAVVVNLVDHAVPHVIANCLCNCITASRWNSCRLSLDCLATLAPDVLLFVTLPATLATRFSSPFAAKASILATALLNLIIRLAVHVI